MLGSSSAIAILPLLAAVAQASTIPGLIATPLKRTLTKRISSGCPTDGPLSCSSDSTDNTCCFETPGGLLLHVQFWDFNPATGPDDSFTIHGLWPDNCDGTYPSNCDPNRAYTNIAGLLSSQGAQDTLDYMNTYWLDVNGQNEQFWEHEWSKHGTCMSTLEPSCLPSGSPTGAEAVAFFQTVVGLHKAHPTFQWLSNAGIVPSDTATYTLDQLNAAVSPNTGNSAAWACTSGQLSGVSYYSNLQGSVIDGNFVSRDPIAGNCPQSGITFPFKNDGSDNGGGSDPPSSGTLPAKGTIHASTTGGLLSAGTWSTQTLATFTFSGSASSFTMKTSKGNCGVSNGALTCGSGVTATSFSATKSGSSLLLAKSGSTAWTSDGSPSGSTVKTVYSGSSHSTDYTLSIVSS